MLSAIGSSRFEMGCDVSDREHEELPTKFSGDCNGVHLGSVVPRKLRSAMKKRHGQSTSPLPHSRKLMSCLSCDGVKRPCLKQGDRSPRETVSGPITKDEEEVVETLYALAGLVFPNNEANGNSKVESEALDANASALPESNNSPQPTVEVGDIKLDQVFPCRADSSISPFVEGLAVGTDQVDLLSKPGTQYQPELFCIESENNIPQNQINISPLSAKVEQCNEKQVFGRKPENAVQKHDMLQESRNNGSGLWPGLSSNLSHAKSDSPLMQAPVATLPPWMDVPCSTSKALVPNGSFLKVTKVVNGRSSCKKCAAHVYISHLIQSLKGSKQGAFLGVNTFTNVKSGFNEDVSSSGICISTAEDVPDEAKNGILQHKKLHLDQPLSTLASGAHTSPKQTFDFLSSSTGGGSLENNDSFSKGRYGMELLSQVQLPYLHSSVQHHNHIPFSLTRSRYHCSASLDSPSVAQQGQLLPSYGNPFCGPQANSTALTKQPIQHQQLHLQQQQQQQQLHLQQHQRQQQQQLHLQKQQQRLWADQYRPAGTLAATAPSPNWQNIKQENCTVIHSGKAFLSPSPSVNEESVGGYRAARALPLQSLCNERL